jgi:hypothetical protein
VGSLQRVIKWLVATRSFLDEACLLAADQIKFCGGRWAGFSVQSIKIIDEK